MCAARLFLLVHGASWVLPDGKILKIPGFHSSWLASHASLAGGATDTAQFVKKSGWISAVLHDGGYLELIVRSTVDTRQRDCLWSLLSTNEATIERAIVMSLDREGCLTLCKPLPESREVLESILDSPSSFE
jgi:hypothetical protein